MKPKTITLQTIKELHDKVQSGEIDGSKLVITLDNDSTSFHIGPPIKTKYGDEWAVYIRVREAGGYYDIEKLYPLLFPKATVEWC